MGKKITSIETSEGEELNNPSEEQIMSILNRFGRGLDHCNFNYGDSFVSASGDAERGIFLYYADTRGREYNSEKPLKPAEVCRVFLDAADGKDDWKTLIPFQQAGGTDDTGSGSSEFQPGQNRNLKDELLSSVKNEALRGLGRLARGGVRGLFGKK